MTTMGMPAVSVGVSLMTTPEATSPVRFSNQIVYGIETIPSLFD